MIERTDVLVVGGGPAGATAAFRLAACGVSVALVDRTTFPREKTCGESLSPGALARLAGIGMWKPRSAAEQDGPKLAPAPQRIRGMKIRSPRGTVFSGLYRSGPDSPPGLAVRRRDFDAELLDRARGQGVRVFEGIEVVGGEHRPDGEATVHARQAEGGRTFRIDAKRVVVADGRQSFLARSLGFVEKEHGPRSQRRYAVRAHCEGLSDLSDLAEMHVGEGGYCGLAPLSATRANVCYVLFTDTVEMRRGTMESDFRREIKRFPAIDQRVQGGRLEGEISIVGPLRVTSRSQAQGGFIACGDTTGFLDPFTGEGIAHAIACGILGARAVQRSIEGHLPSFGEYEREIRNLRRVKAIAARLLYGLVSRSFLANSAASVFARFPRLADSVVQLFGDQV